MSDNAKNKHWPLLVAIVILLWLLYQCKNNRCKVQAANNAATDGNTEPATTTPDTPVTTTPEPQQPVNTLPADLCQYDANGNPIVCA